MSLALGSVYILVLQLFNDCCSLSDLIISPTIPISWWSDLWWHSGLYCSDCADWNVRLHNSTV